MPFINVSRLKIIAPKDNNWGALSTLYMPSATHMAVDDIGLNTPSVQAMCRLATRWTLKILEMRWCQDEVEEVSFIPVSTEGFLEVQILVM